MLMRNSYSRRTFGFQKPGSHLGNPDERAAERDDLAGLVERDVGDRVREGDAVQLLLDVNVARGLALERGLDVRDVGGGTDARLEEGDRRIFDRRVGTLRQGVVDTSPEGLMEDM